MRVAVTSVALLLLLALSADAAEDSGVPVPPAREHDLGETALEEGPAVEARESGEEEGEAAENTAAEASGVAGESDVSISEAESEVATESAAEATEADEADEPSAETSPVEETAAPEPAEVTAEPPEPVDQPAAAGEAVAEPVEPTEVQIEVVRPPEPPEVSPEMESARETAAEDLEAAESAESQEAREESVQPVAEEPVEVHTPPVRPVRSTMKEVELVEHIATAREAYRAALEALKEHYVRRHNATKLSWVEKELAELKAVEKYHYLSEVELAGESLTPEASIPAADQLFAEGMEFKNYPAFPPEKRTKLKVALKKFRQIITDYPTSDKIDDAAFRMGEIYAGWYLQDYHRAAIAYERCFQWDPDTPHPARYRAAKLYDEKIMQRDKAVELYNLVVHDGRNPELVAKAAQRLQELSPE